MSKKNQKTHDQKVAEAFGDLKKVYVVYVDDVQLFNTDDEVSYFAFYTNLRCALGKHFHIRCTETVTHVFEDEKYVKIVTKFVVSFPLPW